MDSTRATFFLEINSPAKTLKIPFLHLDVADEESLQRILVNIPPPPFKVGLAGCIRSCQVQWLENPTWITEYQNDLACGLRNCGTYIHAIQESYEGSLTPFTLKSLSLVYGKPRWTYPFIPAFEEIEHTADIAFQIHGETTAQLFLHGAAALAFHMPEYLNYLAPAASFSSIDEVIIGLNKAISRADTAVGCPFKAVSLHGEISKQKDGTLVWEMIVDV